MSTTSTDVAGTQSPELERGTYEIIRDRLARTRQDRSRRKPRRSTRSASRSSAEPSSRCSGTSASVRRTTAFPGTSRRSGNVSPLRLQRLHRPQARDERSRTFSASTQFEKSEDGFSFRKVLERFTPTYFLERPEISRGVPRALSLLQVTRSSLQLRNVGEKLLAVFQIGEKIDGCPGFSLGRLPRRRRPPTSTIAESEITSFLPRTTSSG